MCTVYLEDFFHLNSFWATFSLVYGTQGIQCVPSSTTPYLHPPGGFLFVLILDFLLLMYMVHLNSCWATFPLVYGTQGIQCVPSSTTTYLHPPCGFLFVLIPPSKVYGTHGIH